MSAMSSYDELKRRAKDKRSGESSGGSSYDDIKESAAQKRYSQEVGNVDDAYINSFLADANSYVSDSKKAFDNITWASATSASDRESRYAKTQDLGYRAKLINYYLENNKDRLGSNTYSSLSEALGSYQNAFTQVDDVFEQYNKHYSQWGSEDEYNTAVRYNGYQQKHGGKTSTELLELIDSMGDGEEKEWLKSYASTLDYNEKSAYDLEAGKREIEELEKQKATLAQKYRDIITGDASAITYLTGPNTSVQDKGNYLGRIEGEESDVIRQIKELDDKINQKKQYLTLAERVQYGIQLSSVADPNSENYDSEFNNYTGYVEGVKYGLGGKPYFDDETYAYINNPTVEDKRIGGGEISARDLLGWNETAMSKDSPYYTGLKAETIYDFMTNDEIAIYNYYYNKQGKKAANEYLDYLKEALNARKAQKDFEKYYEGNKLLELGHSITAGLDQFGSGIANLFNGDDYIPTTYSQYLSSMVREDLADVDLKWYNFKEGEWDDANIFGSSLGQTLYDVGTTTANMAPSILVSTAVGLLNPAAGAWTGATLMGASAAGNAYADALNRGLDKSQAATYGVAIGVSEALLEKALGGISKLGGTSTKITKAVSGIDNALLRWSLRFGGSFASEALEEGLQEILDPIFQNAIFGTDEDVNWSEVAYSALLGGLSAGVFEGNSIRKDINKEQSLKTEYEGKTDALIQEGLESDIDTESFNLAKDYQAKIESGKTLTGAEIRNILAANQEQITPKDMKKIQKAAEARLTELGQTKDVQKLAELATKYATGQKLSKADKAFLANNKNGNRVANELIPENIMSGEYTSEWAEGIGTKQVNKLAYNIKNIIDQMQNPATYKALSDRIGEDEKVSVSDNGKATISGTDEEISIDKKVEVVDFVKDKKTGKITDIIINANGKQVKASEIEYADEDQAYLFSAVKHIENITPADAQVIIRDYNPSSGISVGEYLNGIDEAYTYGYHGYTEADMKSGLFTTKLSDENAKSAYELGKLAKKSNKEAKSEAIKRMRTAVEAEAEKAVAEGKPAPKPKKLAITYNEGNGVVREFDNEALERMPDNKRAGVEVARILHKLGLGTNFEFFESLESKSLKDKKGNPARVFINEAGVEEAAPAGVYSLSDGTIRIDLNAYNGRGLTLYALSHELTHFIQQWSPEKYEILAEYLVSTYEKTGLTMHKRVLREQARLQEIRGEEISYNEAYDEVVANAMMKMFDDGNLVQRLTELKAKDKDLAMKLWEGIKDIFNKLLEFLNVYQSDPGVFRDTKDLMQMKEDFEVLQGMFAEALVDASENFQANLSAVEVGVEPVAVEDVSQFSYSSLAEAAGFEAVMNDDGTRSFTREGKKVSKVTTEDIENSPIGAFINFSLEMGDISKTDADRQKKMFADICTMACKTNDFAMTMQFVGSAVFTGMKANADKQYGTTYDFPSICTKTQAVIDAMSAKMVSLGRGLTTDEIVQLYDDVFASGNPVPCPECYVFSRWIGIGGLLDNIKKYQDYYGDMDVKDVADAYLKMKAEVSQFAEEHGISFGKAKGAMTSKFTKEYNNLTEKIEKAENQGEKVKPADRQRLAELEPMMNTVKAMTWLENVYFADSSLKKVNPNFRVPNSVLFDLNNGEAFATKYKEAWAFRTTQGAGYGKAITPYAEARLGEGVLVTNNTTNAIKGKARGSLDNYFLKQMGKLDKNSRAALKKARLKQLIQAFIGGQRFQSTSDARYENASDYLLAALEMQAMRGMVQAYTKVDGAVPAFSAWGFSINQSLMPLNGGLDANGNIKDTAVGGMKPEVAFKNREKHETAGTITIGVNDNHIRAMFKQWVRDFIIPYHASGGKADVVAEFRRIQEGKEAKGKAVRSTDYSRTQSDKVLSDDVLRWQGKTDAQIQRIHEIRDARIAILTGGKPNMTVVRSNRFLSALYDKLNGGEWDGVKLAKSKVESQIFPNEFWDQTVTYDESAKITKDYLEYCEDLGFLHRFSGMIPSNGKLVPVNGYNENGERVQLTDLAYKYDENGNKTAEVEEFFWKVLTDRRMYDNNGNYLAQKVVTLNDTTTDTVTGFAKNNHGRQYDKAKAEALAKKIVGEQYSSQETDLDTETDSAYDGGKKKTEQEDKANVRREEVSHRGNVESQGEVGKENSGRESSKRESCERRIKEILRRKVLGTNNERTSGRGRVEAKEDRADFESRVRNDGLMYVEIGRSALAFNVATAMNENASIAASTLGRFGFDVIVFQGNLQRNGKGVTETSNAGIMARSAGSLTIFISSELGIDGMETAYHEAFHAARYGMLAKHHEKIADIIASNVDFESESFTEFISIIADLYAYAERNISASKFAAEIIEEFYAWYVGKSYATESGDMQEYMAEFSNMKSIKEQIDRVYAQMEANENKALPGLLNGQLFSSQETDADVGYHAGDLGKAESLRQQGLGRDTGHFGTGTYFVGNKAFIEGYNSRNGKPAPVETVDFNKYNLFKPKNAHDGFVLHDFLRGVDGYWNRDPDAVNTMEEYESLQEKLSELAYDIESEEFGETDPNKESWMAVEKEFLSNAKRMMGDYKVGKALTDTLNRLTDGNYQYDARSGEYYSYDFDTDRFTSYTEDEIIRMLNAEEGGWKAYEGIEKLADDYYSYSRTSRYESWSESIDDVAKVLGISEQKVRSVFQSVTDDIKSSGYTDADMETADSAATRFMKALGYEGIDVRGIKGLDNTSYGSVIYDLKGEDLARKKEIGTARYSTQETDNISNRDMLANAFETLAQNSEEYKMIQDYKNHIRLLNEYEEKLSKLNAEIREITFGTEGERDYKRLRELQAKAKEMAGHINRHDKKLIEMEASAPLRKVIEQERKKEAQKTREHIGEILQNKKVRAEQTEYRHKIRKVVRDLNKILKNGNKKQNVKEDMKGFVSKALELADYLFQDHVSNDDLIRKGITVPMRGNEAQLVKETEEILNKLYDEADSLTDEEFTRLDAKRKRNLEKLRDLLTEQRNERLRTPVYKLFDDLVTEYASLKNSNQESVKAAYDPNIERFLRSYIGETDGETDSDRKTLLQNMRVADMTTDELWKLYNAYTMVLKSVRDANKLHVKGRTESIEQMVTQIVTEFGKRNIPDKKLAIVARNIANKIGWDYEKLHYALDRIGSDAFTELIMNLADSENIVMQDIIEAAEFRDQIVEKYGFNDWDVNKEIDREFLDNTGKKFKLTLGQLMSLYAYSRRDGAWDHIEYGGFVFGEKALTNPKPADSYKLSKAQCEAITNTLTKEQKAYVEDMQKFLSETMGAKGNEVSMELYGIKMFGEKNYFPIHIAGQFKAQAQESQAKQAAGFGSMSNAGFTHAQNPNAKAPFVLEAFNDVWADHVNEMSRYHGTVPALEDIRRVMNRSSYSESTAESTSVKAMMENYFGKEAVDYFDNLYREANSGAIRDKLDAKSQKLLSLFRKGSVAYSFSVLIQQPASIVRAYAMINKKYFGIHGFGTITSGVVKTVADKLTKTQTKAYNEMLKYAPGVTMAKEIGGFDTATGGSIRSYLLDTNKSFIQSMKTENLKGKGKALMNKVDDNAIANLPNVADKIAWIEIWNACKRETAANHKDLATSSDEFMQIVGERFTEVIRATQVYDSIFAKSPMLKSKSLAVQYLVSFMNEPNTVANMAESAVRDATRGNWKSGARKAVSVIYSIIFTDILKSLVYAMRDDDEDETYIEKYIEAFTSSLMDDFNALNYIPLVRDAWSVAQGYDVERADMAIVSDAVSALGNVIKNATKDTDGMTEDELVEFDKKVTEAKWKLVESLAGFFGIPAKNIRREINGVIDHARIASANAGQTTAMSAWDKVRDAVIDSIPFMSNDKTKNDKLYSAIVNGDTAYVDRMKDTYKTEDAYHNAVRKALRANDSRIKEAALAEINGNPSERVRIQKLIKADGFDQDDVVAATNSEIAALTPDDDSDSGTDKKKGFYTTENLVREFANGDTASAKAAKSDIISTAISNGKTKEQAEKDFMSSVSSSAKEAYENNWLSESKAKKLLMEYAGEDEEGATSKVNYWTLCKLYPKYKDLLTESRTKNYNEFVKPAGISMDMYAQFLTKTKDLADIKDANGKVKLSKQDQVIDVIDALPITRRQKNALFLAAGYAESTLKKVRWS